MGAAELITLPQRIANALVSYAWYPLKMVWPSGLSVLYPHPYLPGGTPWASWQIACAVVFLAGGSVAAVRFRQQGYVAVGWLWYLGTLIPVIGLVQVGDQGLADRYSYVPLVGLFVAVVWAVGDLSSRWRGGRELAAALAVLALLACAWLSFQRAAEWRSSVVLFENTLAVTANNRLIMNNLAWVLATHPEAQTRDGERAVELAERAVELTGGGSPGILDTLAAAYADTGDFERAESTARRARELAARSRNPDAVRQIDLRLEGYRRGMPHREWPPELAAQEQR